MKNLRRDPPCETTPVGLEDWAYCVVDLGRLCGGANLAGAEKPLWHGGNSMTCTSGIQGEHPRKMLKMAAQQGRSE